MGTDSNEQGARRLHRPRGENKVVGTADWALADSALLIKVICKVGIKHGAIRLGYTRDGGAYSVGVYAGDEYFTDYVRPGEDIDAYLQDLLQSFEDYDPGMEPPKKRVSKK
jgi:hypothetical protein